NYTLQLDGASGITFRNLTLAATDRNYGRVIDLRNGASCNTFSNTIISGVSTTSTEDDMALVYSPSNDSPNNNNHFTDNYLINGSLGFSYSYLSNRSNDRETGLLISGNTLQNQRFVGISLAYQKSPLIEKNIITSSQTGFNGVHLYDNSDSLKIVGNKISLPNGGYGLSIYEVESSTAAQGLIANNFISIGGSSTAYGIYSYYSSHQRYYHNNVHLYSTTTSTDAVAFVIDYGTNNEVYNNILVNSGGGYAFYTNTRSAEADYNDLYVTGTRLGYYSGNQTDLAAWQSATGWDGHSLSVDPLFVDSADLHVANVLLDGTGIPVPGVTKDIDGQVRDQVSPDIGADEFSGIANDLAVTRLIAPLDDCGQSDTEKVSVTIQNFGNQAQTGFDLALVVNEGTPIVENTDTLTVEAGLSATYTFTTSVDLSTLGEYTFSVFPLLSEDENNANDTLQVTVNSYPAFNTAGLTADTAICLGSSVVLEASGGSTYTWNNGTTNPSYSVTPDDTTTYFVTIGNDLGCTIIDSVTVYVLPLPEQPEIIYGGPTIICEGDSLLLVSSVIGNLQWSTDERADSIYVKEAGTYYVSLTGDNACVSTSPPLTVEVAAVPRILPEEAPFICLGDSVVLSVVNGSASYLWSTGDTTAIITVVPMETTTYYVEAANDLGCLYTDSIKVEVTPPLAPSEVSNMLPSDETTGLSLPVRFSWAPGTNATWYDLYIWPDTASVPGTPTAGDLTSIQYIYNSANSAWEHGTSYLWQVMSRNACYETPGPIQTFTLRELPDLQVQNVEAPDEAFSEQEISVSWEVINTGLGATLEQNWTDAIYLSGDNTLSLEEGDFMDEYLLGTANFAALSDGESYANNATVTLPRGIAGYHYLFVKADRYESLTETNDQNNEARILDTLLINLRPTPDLQVTHLLPPSNAFSEQEVTLSYTVTNRGNGETEANSRWRDAIYLTDSESTSGGTFLTNVYRSGILGVDSSYTETVTVTLPRGIFGDYYFYVVTDVSNQVYEYTFEENNRALSEAVNVILTPPIDLAVTNIETEPVASNNENVVIRWEVTNQGGSSVLNTSWVDKVYLSATPEFEQVEFLGSYGKSVTDLQAGESYFAQKTVKIPDAITGPFYVIVRTDASNGVYEYVYESNNDTKSDSVLMVQNADLTVTEFQVPETIFSGEVIRVSWTVKNIGIGSIFGERWTDAIGLVPNDGSDAFIRIGSLPRNGTMSPGDSLSGGILVTIPEDLSGDYQLTLRIDNSNNVYEGTKEDNNVLHKNITILPSPVPDLEITKGLAVDTATSGEYIPVTFTVENTGDTLITNTSWEDQIYLSSDSRWNPGNARLIKRLPRSQEVLPGEGYTVTDLVPSPILPFDVSMKTYYLYFLADGNERIYERSNESNNMRRSDPIYVFAYNPPDSENDPPDSENDSAVFVNNPPDFIVSNLAIEDSVSSGERTYVVWTTENIGNNWTTNAYASWWSDGVYLSEDTVWDNSDTFLRDWVFYQSDIETGSYEAGMQFYDFPNGISGDYFILMVADHTNRINERDKTNNYRWKPIHVILSPSPDLVVTDLKLPSLGIAGQAVDLSWMIENQGEGRMLQDSYSVRTYLSYDLVLDN
ncbi:MAG: CARDB domain-containing protein, partial [Bacteroidota bacterium]